MSTSAMYHRNTELDLELQDNFVARDYVGQHSYTRCTAS